MYTKIFIEQSPAAIAMFDTDLNYIAASFKWLEDYKLGDIDIVGKSHYQIFPNMPTAWKDIHQAALKGAVLKNKEDSMQGVDGSIQWISWEVRPWYINPNKIGGLIMYTEDITAQKEISLAHEKIEKNLDKTNEVARIGTWEVLLKEQKIIWSRITKEIHEVEPDYEPKLDAGINFYKEGRSRTIIEKAVANAIEKGENYDVELELITYKGNPIWVRSIGQAEMLNGECVRLFGVFQDITNTKNYQKSLRDANNELNALFNSGPVSIISTDKDGIITKFNKGAETLLQYTAEEMVGKQSPLIIHLEEEFTKRGEELSAIYGKEITGFDVFVEVSKHKDFESREWTYVRKDGSFVSVELIVTALRNDDDEITGYLGVATDVSEKVTQRKEMLAINRNLEILTQNLTQKNKQLASFSHITSHNLRSPVGNLNALLQFYKMAETEEEKEMLFEKLELVTNHLTSTLDTLVDTLRIKENDQQDLQLIAFEDVLMKTQEIFSGQILESKAQINYNFNSAPKIKYNLNYLESIFLNLISNSLKYRSPVRTPIITIKTEIKEGKTILTFEDNGLGIDLVKHGDKIFGLNNTFHEHIEAKGVGLYMTKIQVEALGGEISAKSELDKGTIFTINF